MKDSVFRTAYREKRHKAKQINCHCCTNNAPFCWRCRCGFAICQECMLENIWGMSCNGINPQNTQCIPVVKIFAFLGLEQK